MSKNLVYTCELDALSDDEATFENRDEDYNDQYRMLRLAWEDLGRPMIIQVTVKKVQ